MPSYYRPTNTLVSNGDIRARLSNANRIVATRSRTRSGGALPPRNMELLGESNGSIIVRQLACGIGDLGSKRNAVVDVENAIAAARRPDGGSGLDAVLLGVDLAIEQRAAAGE